MKRCSTSLTIREIQTKTIVNYHFISVRMDSIEKKSTSNKCWRKGILLHCWWECKLVQPLQKTFVWRFLSKLKIELPFALVIPLLDIYPDKTIIWKYICTSLFIAALLTIANTWTQSKHSSTDECMKMWYICTMEYHLSYKKEQDNAICSNIDGTRYYHTKWGK